ncbi:MAG TPA: ribosome recycling factor [Candidatus Binatia bacterium]|nr:ribosome recycling factor [Candidatus Binatia bacterium]
MSPNHIIEQAKTKLSQSVQHFQDEIKKLRTGRANASMLDGVLVEAYGSQMPLNQVATVSVPESQLIQLSPFDPNNLQAISAAIRDNQSLGLNPSDDGRVVRVPIPPLTEERRREIVKLVGQKQEDCMVNLRNVRHETLDQINSSKKSKELSEDEAKRLEKQIDDLMNVMRDQVEATVKNKEAEIMTV